MLIDPNFANWLFLLKRVRRAGLKIQDLPPIDLVLLTHAHFDHFHRPTLRRLNSPKIAIVPWGVGDLARIWASSASSNCNGGRAFRIWAGR